MLGNIASLKLELDPSADQSRIGLLTARRSVSVGDIHAEEGEERKVDRIVFNEGWFFIYVESRLSYAIAERVVREIIFA